MCNLYRMEKAPDAVAKLGRELGRQLEFPEGVPNFEPRELRITDRAPILRAGVARDSVALVERRWSWPEPGQGAGGRPVFNFRAEGRSFSPADRCVAIADGFYEFTAPATEAIKRKDRWLFTWPGHEWFGIAGLVRSDPAVGERLRRRWCCWRGLNSRPHPYQGCALPLSYSSVTIGRSPGAGNESFGASRGARAPCSGALSCQAFPLAASGPP